MARTMRTTNGERTIQSYSGGRGKNPTTVREVLNKQRASANKPAQRASVPSKADHIAAELAIRSLRKRREHDLLKGWAPCMRRFMKVARIERAMKISVQEAQFWFIGIVKEINRALLLMDKGKPTHKNAHKSFSEQDVLTAIKHVEDQMGRKEYNYIIEDPSEPGRLIPGLNRLLTYGQQEEDEEKKERRKKRRQ